MLTADELLTTHTAIQTRLKAEDTLNRVGNLFNSYYDMFFLSDLNDIYKSLHGSSIYNRDGKPPEFISLVSALDKFSSKGYDELRAVSVGSVNGFEWTVQACLHVLGLNKVLGYRITHKHVKLFELNPSTTGTLEVVKVTPVKYHTSMITTLRKLFFKR